MATVSLNELVSTLRQHRLLRPAHLDELANLPGRWPEPGPLLQELVRRDWLTAFQARQLFQGRGAGLVLGPYLLLEQLGEGGNGRVFKARHQSMDRIVALKVLRKDLLGDAEAVGRFSREVEVISQLSHPAIVHAYDAGVVGATHFLALEYVEGKDLDRLVKESGRLPVAQACDYIRQAALGLQYAHERGLVHRDIKPSNLLVDRTVETGTRKERSVQQILGATPWGVIKILDLGLARLQQPAGSSRTANLTVIAGNSTMQGTPDYLAPEQAIDFHSADIRADIYSLGCTFHFLLTAQPPFGTGSLSQKLMRHQQVEPPPVEKLRDDLPSALPGILRQMLAKRSADRFQTPGDLARALEPLCHQPTQSIRSRTDSTLSLSGELTPASGVTPLLPEPRMRTLLTRRLPSRRRLKLVGLLVALALLAGVLIWALQPGGERNRFGSVAEQFRLRPVLYFNGQNVFVPLPDNVFRSSATITLEAWFATADGGIIIGYQNTKFPQGAGSHVPVISVGTDGKLRGQFWNGGTRPITSPRNVNDHLWHHACLVADGTAKMQTLYLDGQPLGTLPGALQHLDMQINQVGTGWAPGWPAMKPNWFTFTGMVAEVRVWHVARSPAEIQQTMNQPLTGAEPGLVAYYPMDETAGDAVVDRSPLARNTVLGNGVQTQKPIQMLVPTFLR